MIVFKCNCGKKNKGFSKPPLNPFEYKQKHIVEIHVMKQENDVSFLTNVLKNHNIKYEIIVDKRILNRPYPYLMVNGEITCIKRVLSAFTNKSL